MNNRGFSLIELLIVVSIIGILVAVSVTAYIGVTLKAARSEAYANLNSLRLLEEQFFAENACYQPLVAGVCPAAGSLLTTAAIQGVLPGFRPGTGLSFTYRIDMNQQLTGGGGNTTGNPPGTAAIAAGAPPCFVATATGIAGTRVCQNAANCDMFAIDCNNIRNF